ncbi:dethiobiotin synthase [Cellvibrio japonicus]|uniref:ATP-dependent dethiobiotin synthetase BioD n=1 Tax=Cellvibrio japonicus (strain Ueda107) TaxID=498211 RepID=BIOD_CELJU|nr:dethiobiotin synthase [Cellvibrio japonicus]B3PI90.1 RecName: Full=ATP-dependent dethiobiotin synthetase BioD; AltName: Full=DTB synthetase; Short=DTBS; AltName: Full=Dethiobiotin synthase [Cellvibrio japonicus Ueda107]ACE86043.1 dethiobiotin synthase [Cellvibrio japonicus Ueda107]QEI11132.1 ATP-dependent dethiobiotin synthetase BioD [Cellvibrio japonicus]QEI14706.1 ATP-dependent dethiobiotin synthetase BioD [Cellvibrio japonicus]QEI18286.1 ATP-dependent dethiobiotin synthetase BioD [Cellvi
MSKKAFFITGTDTDAGKTLVATGLLAAARLRGLSTLGLKPVAAGCTRTEQGLRNSDALALQAQSTLPVVYEQVNPVALEAAIAPHIAALQEKRSLSADRLAGFCRSSLRQADFTLVEGAGGWRVPLNPSETLANLAQLLRLPVVLVVGMRLGCINHALLTVEAIRNDGLPLVGWVANVLDADMPVLEENIASLAQRIPAPCLGVVPRLSMASADAASAHLDLTPLLDA